jgi:tricorn protease
VKKVYSLQDWTPDGKRLLVQASRDHFWRHPERFFTIQRNERTAEELVFDDYGSDGMLSPDGKKLLFTREGPAWWRKGYHGSQASQVWLYDLEPKAFRRILDDERGSLWPLWKPDGKGFYFVGGKSGSFNLWEHDLESGKERQLTKFSDDSVVFPCLSRDGSTLVFRHLFDFYRLRPASNEPPQKISITHADDRPTERIERRTLQQASEVAFTADGLEMAFIAGGDLWVMDTELREPRRVTRTPEEERHPVFTPDGEAIYFVSDAGGQCDLWKAVRKDAKKPWFRNDSFKLEKITQDGEVKSALKFSPDGGRIGYVRGRGDLYVADANGANPRKILASFSPPEYDWSPDGNWLAYAVYDDDFNRDVWLAPVDGSRKPYNLSRHPFNDSDPVWSPDGKIIAFLGRHEGTEMGLHYVWLRAEDDEQSSRDRTIQKALDKINKGRNPGPRRPDPPLKEIDSADSPLSARETRTPAPAKANASKVVIDFDRLHERIRHVALPNASVSGLFWSPDSKKLAFTTTIEGRSGTYTIDLPDDPRPRLLTTQTRTQARWLKQGNQIVRLVGGIPASFTAGGGAPRPTTGAATGPTPSIPPGRRGGAGAGAAAAAAASEEGGGTLYRFQALQEVDLRQHYAAAFDLCWRTMRDQFYDERLGNRDWNAIRTKYKEAAAEAPDVETLATVVQLMLGELNGSHLGFMPSLGGLAGPARRGGPRMGPTESSGWNEITVHLGVRFDPDYRGMGLKIRDVLPGGPADQNKSRLKPGELVLAIDGKPVDPTTDLTTALNGPAERDVVLKVKDATARDREVTIRPTTFLAARLLLYEAWLRHNREVVEKASDGKLGYLHISAMSMPSFHKFEEELYSVGAGKDGLVIDVRENGGGSTTDHLLTALTQPVHAITVPRGGGPGYPQDRKIYATWNKPIVVLCNQNSFSNAEIFSHAIKTLKRGQLVGVPTAGGVISTGGTQIMDVGFLRLPFRGWYLIEDGQDMELRGAVPHHIVWPEPGQMPRGQDVQLAKAVEVLLADVKAWQARPRPKLHKASER